MRSLTDLWRNTKREVACVLRTVERRAGRCDATQNEMLACLPRIAKLLRTDPRVVDYVWSVSEVITDDEDDVTRLVSVFLVPLRDSKGVLHDGLYLLSVPVVEEVLIL